MIGNLIEDKWGCALLKPSFASFSVNLFKLCISQQESKSRILLKRDQLIRYFQGLNDAMYEEWQAEFSAVYFVESVRKNWHLRLFFHGGELAHVVGKRDSSCGLGTEDCDNGLEFSWYSPITHHGTLDIAPLPFESLVEMARNGCTVLRSRQREATQGLELRCLTIGEG